MASFPKPRKWGAWVIVGNLARPFKVVEQVELEEYGRRQERAALHVPLRRLGRLREVGLLAVYLASDASAYVTGQSFVIDGGLSIA